MTFQDIPVDSSTFQACANPGSDKQKLSTYFWSIHNFQTDIRGPFYYIEAQVGTLLNQGSLTVVR